MNNNLPLDNERIRLYNSRMRVVDDGYFTVYVYYDEFHQQHHLPHCHVRCSDGETVVALLTMERIIGKPLSVRAKKLIVDNIDEICLAWDETNPEMKIRNE